MAQKLRSSSFVERIEKLEDSEVELVADTIAWCREHGGDRDALWASCPRGEWAIVIALAAGARYEDCLAAAARAVCDLAEEWKGDGELLALARRMVSYIDGDDDAEITSTEISDLEMAMIGVDDPARAIARGVDLVGIGLANGYIHQPARAVQQVTRGMTALGYSMAQAGEITADTVRREVGPLAAAAARD